jgi:hypothetical protein
MEIIYRTFDGKEFDNEADACYHESVLRDGIKMWDRVGRERQETSAAFVLYLADEEANLAFFDMAEKQGDFDIAGITKGEDYGLYVWDECDNAYHWVDEEELSVLMVAAKYIERERVEKTLITHKGEY